MNKTKKITSLVLAVMMVVSMLVVGTVAASAYTLSELVTAIQAGGTVVLDKDFSYSGSLGVPAGKTVVLDLAGHEIKSVDNCGICNQGTLTIIDSVGGGKVTAQEMCVLTLDGATTTIESGTYTAKDNAVFGTNGTNGRGGCTITINDGTFNGTIESAGFVACGIYAPNNDTWNVNGGTFNITNGIGVAQRAGTVNIADGVVFNVTGDGTTGKVGDSRVVLPSGTGIVYDSEAAYPGQTAADKTVVTGGTFNTQKAAAATVKATGDTNDRIAISGGSFDTAPAAEFVTGTTITDGTRTYVGYDGVINSQAVLEQACAQGGKWVLGTSFNSTGATVDANVDLVIDLADKSLKVPAWGFIIKGKLTIIGTSGALYSETCGVIDNYGELEIKSGTINGNGAGVAVWNDPNASIVIDGGMIVAAASGGYAINNVNGDVTMNDGTIVAGNTGICSDGGTATINGGSIVSDRFGVTCFTGSTTTVNGGTIEGRNDVGISGNGTATGYVININGGVIKSNDTGVYHPGNGALNISGGTITGSTGVYVKSGTTDITGGTINATGAADSYTFNGNGCNNTGNALAVDSCKYPGGAPTVNVTGGTFNAAHADAVGSYTKAEDPSYTGDDSPVVDDFISGGTFSSNVTSLCVDGLAAESTGGVFTIVPFEINGKADIQGYQDKIQKTEQSSANTGNDINTKGVRIVTKVDRDWLDDNADEYGYIVGKYSGNKTIGQMDFTRLNTNNGAKKIVCTGSENNIRGLGAGYVTLAVNGMANGEKVVARFYVVVNGTTYFANYSNYDGIYDGILATYTVQ